MSAKKKMNGRMDTLNKGMELRFILRWCFTALELKAALRRHGIPIPKMKEEMVVRLADHLATGPGLVRVVIE
jgi:hypothetical protein